MGGCAAGDGCGDIGVTPGNIFEIVLDKNGGRLPPLLFLTLSLISPSQSLSLISKSPLNREAPTFSHRLLGLRPLKKPERFPLRLQVYTLFGCIWLARRQGHRTGTSAQVGESLLLDAVHRPFLPVSFDGHMGHLTVSTQFITFQLTSQQMITSLFW